MNLKSATGLTAVLLTMLALTGCSFTASPAMGVFYTGVKFGDAPGPSASAAKTGRSCATTVIGFAWGDASIETAAKKGEITAIAYVDHETTNVLGVYGTWCTIVKGS